MLIQKILLKRNPDAEGLLSMVLSTKTAESYLEMQLVIASLKAVEVFFRAEEVPSHTK